MCNMPRYIWYEPPFINCLHAGRCSDRSTCAEGDSTSEPYICAHTLLAAHGAAVQQMRAVAPSAKISLNLDSVWTVPYTNSSADTVSSSTTAVTCTPDHTCYERERLNRTHPALYFGEPSGLGQVIARPTTAQPVNKQKDTTVGTC